MSMNRDDRNKYVYVVLSKTPSKFAKLVRTFGKITYNHASIAFDERLDEMWAFARKKNNLPLDAGVVREYPERFTLKKEGNIPVRVYKLPVTEEQYDSIRNRVQEVHEDDKYHYNLFSAILYPLAGGFETHKAYTCSEFVATLLDEYTDVDMNRRCSSVIPEELHGILEPYMIYDGNLLSYREFEPVESAFFDEINPFRVAGTTIAILVVLVFRSAEKARKDLERLHREHMNGQN